MQKCLGLFSTRTSEMHLSDTTFQTSDIQKTCNIDIVDIEEYNIDRYRREIQNIIELNNLNLPNIPAIKHIMK